MPSSLLHQFLPMGKNKCLICFFRFRSNAINKLGKDDLRKYELATSNKSKSISANSFTTTSRQRYAEAFMPLFQVCENGLDTLLLVLTQANTSRGV
jgi:hypothetical protein